MGSFLKLALVLTFLSVNAFAFDPEQDLVDEESDSSLVAASKYTCKKCYDYEHVWSDGRRTYAYSVYDVFYDGKFHSESEHFPSRGKCAAAYDSDHRCSK